MAKCLGELNSCLVMISLPPGRKTAVDEPFEYGMADGGAAADAAFYALLSRRS